MSKSKPLLLDGTLIDRARAIVESLEAERGHGSAGPDRHLVQLAKLVSDLLSQVVQAGDAIDIEVRDESAEPELPVAAYMIRGRGRPGPDKPPSTRTKGGDVQFSERHQRQLPPFDGTRERIASGRPHVCPLCLGEGKVPDQFGSGSNPLRPCPTCNATGIVWPPDGEQHGR